jgi:hypothetical protein
MWIIADAQREDAAVQAGQVRAERDAGDGAAGAASEREDVKRRRRACVELPGQHPCAARILFVHQSERRLRKVWNSFAC